MARRNSAADIDNELRLDEIRIQAREMNDDDCERFYAMQKQISLENAAVVKEVLSDRGITMWDDEE